MKRRNFFFLPFLGLFRPRWVKCTLHCAVTNGIIRIEMIDILANKVPKFIMNQIKLDIGWKG